MSERSWQKVFAAKLITPELQAPDGLVTHNGSDPLQRFGVYRNNVIVSLVDALAVAYPVTQALVGEDFFRAMAQRYLREQPPRHRSMLELGASLPAFIAQFEPAHAVPYLAGIAQLERALQNATHAADLPAIANEDLASLLGEPDALARLRFGLHPSVAVLHSPFALASIWNVHQGESNMADVRAGEPESMIVYRVGVSARVQLVSASDAAFVDGLLNGRTLSDALIPETLQVSLATGDHYLNPALHKQLAALEVIAEPCHVEQMLGLLIGHGLIIDIDP